MLDIPLGLRHAVESGECVLFLGAGMGFYLLDKDGNGAPDAKSLADELAQEYSIPSNSSSDLAKISELVELRKGRPELENFIRSKLANHEPDNHFQWLSTIRWKAIYTTNYDNGIQRSYELNKSPLQILVTVSVTSELTSFNPQIEVPVYHLHGRLFGTDKPHIVVTSGDYACFRERRRMLFELLKIDFASSPVLYLGYSNNDPNWNMVLSEITSEFFPSDLPRSFRIAPNPDIVDVEILRSKNIETIDCKYDEFQQSIAAILATSQIGLDHLQLIEKSVPDDFKHAFSTNPIPVTRFLTSWTYVNQAPLSEAPNISSFLKGDRPNWGLIASEDYMVRDIEEDLYNDMLDYATSTKQLPSIRVILGSAGYGTTTLLMAIAAKIVQDRAGKAFVLKPGQTLVEGDIDFAISLFPDNCFFFIDNAVEFSESILSINQRLKETNSTAMLVLGERLNEWRQGHGRLNAKEFAIEPLSDPEINRLLDFLGKHAALIFWLIMDCRELFPECL